MPKSLNEKPFTASIRDALWKYAFDDEVKRLEIRLAYDYERIRIKEVARSRYLTLQEFYEEVAAQPTTYERATSYMSLLSKRGVEMMDYKGLFDCMDQLAIRPKPKIRAGDQEIENPLTDLYKQYANDKATTPDKRDSEGGGSEVPA